MDILIAGIKPTTTAMNITITIKTTVEIFPPISIFIFRSNSELKKGSINGIINVVIKKAINTITIDSTINCEIMFFLLAPKVFLTAISLKR